MEKVKRKQRQSRPHLRWVLLGVLLLALACCGLALSRMNREEPVTLPDRVDEGGQLAVHTAAEVTRVEVALPGGDAWALRQQDGALSLEDDPGFTVDEDAAGRVLDAASIVSYVRILTEDSADYQSRLEEFGLDDPCVVRITYQSGETCTLRIGDRSQGDEVYYYMTVDGDARLFAADAGTVEELMTDRYLLHALTQPTIHASRMDEIVFSTPSGEARWRLNGAIDAPDAIDRWQLISPLTYPADGERMDAIKSQLERLRLGAYLMPATAENLTACGLDAPRLTITLHMAAGRTGMVGESGTYQVTDWPESEVTFEIGGTYADYISYVRYEDGIYLMSDLTLSPLLSLTAADTLNRYPVLTTLSNLNALTVTDEEGVRTYEVSRTVQTDEDGSEVTVSTARLNGEEISWDAFSNAYGALLLVTVSGALPEGWSADAPPHTVYEFSTQTGADHTIALTSFDAMHDAVLVDGSSVFYLIKDALHFAPAEQGAEA